MTSSYHHNNASPWQVVGPVHLLHHVPSLQLLVLATEQAQLVTLPTR